MQRLLTFGLIVLWSGATWASKPDLAMGLGLETRAQRDVNPDATTAKSTDEFYGKIRFFPWALEIETGREESASGSGSLTIKSESTLLGVWGRYEFAPPTMVAPFASLGMGSYFDVIDTSFAASHDRRQGVRKFMGAGGGLTMTLWDHLQMEIEGRIISLEETKDPVLSGLIRVGCQI
jgi:hypothetical protein